MAGSDMNETQVINAFAWHIKHMTFPNILFYPWESDILALTDDNRMFEYEVKLTLADYRQDAKKVRKHETLVVRGQPCPNRFCYLLPRDLVSNKITLPDYAGLWSFDTRHDYPSNFRQEKRGPLLHQQTVDVNDLHRLFASVYHRYWQVRRDVSVLESYLQEGKNWKMLREWR